MPSMLAMINNIEGDILDFGSGAGNFTYLLKRADRRVEGCDPSAELVCYADKQFPDVHFSQCSENGDIDTNKKFDLITAKLVFHYIDDLGKLLSKLALFLNPNGRLCFSIPHPDKTQLHFDVLTKEGPYVDEVGKFGLMLTMYHRSEKYIRQILSNTGYKIEDINIVFDSSKPKRLNILVSLRH